MTRRRQTPEPVPVAPTHRRDRRTFWRRCICGLTSPCVDRLVPAPPRPFPPRTATAPHRSVDSPEERSPRYPTLIEYLATVPFPVHFGVAVLRVFPTEPPDSPDPSLPSAPVGHPGGSGALGGPGSRPCPGSRAGAASLSCSHTPEVGRLPAARHLPTVGHTPVVGRLPTVGHTSAIGRLPTVGHTPVVGRLPTVGHTPVVGRLPTVGHTPVVGRPLRGFGPAAVDPVAARLSLERGRRDGRTNTTQMNGGPCQRGERAGERVGRLGAGDPRAGSNGGRRGRLPAFGGRPAMAYHHINLSRR